MAQVTHVAVDATRLPRERRGIGRYVRNLLQAMPVVRPDIRYTLYTREKEAGTLREQLISLEGVAERSVVRPVNEFADGSADISWHAWNWILRPTRVPMVVSIMDLVPMLRFDHRWWKVIRRAKARVRYRRTIKHASRILAISSFTAQEITRLLGVPYERVRVTLLGADDFGARKPVARGTGAAYAGTIDLGPGASFPDGEHGRLPVPTPFFLAVGAQEARKNLGVLFRAMSELNSVSSRAGQQANLVLCGPGARLEGVANRHGAPWLHYAGYVSDRELAGFYSQTAALVFPSLYEGFGLPVLEAMTAGAPVICARASSLPEVGGDAVLYFDPADSEDLVHQMERLLSEPQLTAELKERMKARVAKFSWKKCAEETLQGFDEALEIGTRS